MWITIIRPQVSCFVILRISRVFPTLFFGKSFWQNSFCFMQFTSCIVILILLSVQNPLCQNLHPFLGGLLFFCIALLFYPSCNISILVSSKIKKWRSILRLPLLLILQVSLARWCKLPPVLSASKELLNRTDRTLMHDASLSVSFRL